MVYSKGCIPTTMPCSADSRRPSRTRVVAHRRALTHFRNAYVCTHAFATLTQDADYAHMMDYLADLTNNLHALNEVRASPRTHTAGGAG